MTPTTMSAVLERSVEVDAATERVWEIVSDLRRMGEWSPQCRRMVVLGRDVGLGTRTLNVNRKGVRVWPTTAKVVAFSPGERIAFRVVQNRSVWSFTLEPTATGTTVTERREAPNGTNGFSQFLIRRFLGGNDGLERDLVAGMDTTLARIRTEAER